MKKTIISLLLSMVMALTLFPVTSYADYKDIVDVINTYTSDFPHTENWDTPPADAWVREDGLVYCYSSNYCLYIYKSENDYEYACISFAYSCNSQDGCYVCNSTLSVEKIEFYIENGELTSIVIIDSGNYAGLAGTYRRPTPASSSDPEPQVYYLDPLEDKFEAAIENGSTETIYWNEGDAIPNDIMKTLKNNPELSFDFRFIYEGAEHEVYIGPGQATDDDIEWYGPAWLIQHYGDKLAASRTYTIQEGDTLNAIAEKLGVSVDELMEKNPAIKDRNKIYPNDILIY